MKPLFIASVLLLLPAAPSQAAESSMPARPNIVVILADDLGYGDLGCYGATKVRTPNIDRLSREGMRFTDAHSPSSVCTPSRYNLLTGRYSWRTWAKTGAVWANDPLLIEDGRLTVASLLKRVGYATACIGKWHLGFGRPGMAGWNDLLGPDFNVELRPGPCEVGFDYFFGMPAIGQQPNVFIENHRVVGLTPGDPIRFIPDRRPEFQTDYLHRPRTDNVRLGLADSTLLVFTSDNGGTPECLEGRNGPLRGFKTDVWEGGHRVPFIVRWPGKVKPGSQSDQLLANTDLLATFAAITSQRLPPDAGEDSFSILPALLGKKDFSGMRDTLVDDSWKGLYSIRQGPWKLILGQGGGGLPVPDGLPPADKLPGQLYHLGNDLSEQHNLYAEHPEIVTRLTTLFHSIQSTGRSRP